MHDDAIDPARFGAVFVVFMETVAREAGPPQSLLLERIRAYLGGDVTSLPVMSESFDPFEHLDVQVALDDYFGQPERTAELAGIALEHKRFMELHLSDLVAGSLPMGRSGVAVGPVDSSIFIWTASACCRASSWASISQSLSDNRCSSSLPGRASAAGHSRRSGSRRWRPNLPSRGRSSPSCANA